MQSSEIAKVFGTTPAYVNKVRYKAKKHKRERRESLLLISVIDYMKTSKIERLRIKKGLTQWQLAGNSTTRLIFISWTSCSSERS